MTYQVIRTRNYAVTSTIFADKDTAEKSADFYRNAGMGYTVEINEKAAA
tara:strand:+ start:536 stop:682 length:147 start_codon:yes stop_codon:yes gene_type:complete